MLVNSKLTPLPVHLLKATSSFTEYLDHQSTDDLNVPYENGTYYILK